MKIAKVYTDTFARMLFSEREKEPEALFYLNRIGDGEYKGANRISVIKHSGSMLVIGNLRENGNHLCYEMTSDEDSSGLAKALSDWVVGQNCDLKNGNATVYVDLDGIKAKDAPEIIVEIHDGMLVQVYSTLESLSVELIDRDVTDAKDIAEIDKQLDAIEDRVKSGELFAHW